MSYLLDTNIFNWLLDGRIRLEDLPSDGEFVATHIQLDEINQTPDAKRREDLILMFKSVPSEELPPESMVWGGMKWGHMKWGDGETYTRLKVDLDRAKAKPSNVNDARIAEVAIKNGLTLLTADANLAIVAKAHGCSVRLYRR